MMKGAVRDRVQVGPQIGLYNPASPRGGTTAGPVHSSALSSARSLPLPRLSLVVLWPQRTITQHVTPRPLAVRGPAEKSVQASRYVFHLFLYSKPSLTVLGIRIGLGSVRTATKRAGGTVANHGGSPGKRLGVKKFSGACRVVSRSRSKLTKLLQTNMSFPEISLSASEARFSTRANMCVTIRSNFVVRRVLNH